MEDGIPLLILLVLSGFFSGAEIAFFSLSQAKIRMMLEQRRPGAQLLAKLRHNPERLLVTILIGNNIVNIASSAISTYWATEKFGSSGVGIATGIITFLILTFGEIIPKSIATRYAETITLWIAYPVYLLTLLLTPLTFVFTVMLAFVNRLTGSSSKQYRVSKHELSAMTSMSYEQGIIKKYEKNFINNILQLSDNVVRAAMVRRADIQMINGDYTLQKALLQGLPKQYSRLPVYLNKPTNITGFLYLRDILQFSKDQLGSIKVKDIIRPIVRLPARLPLNQAYRELVMARTHMALVTHRKKIIGLVTLEDIIEEVLGDIQDETDKGQDHGGLPNVVR